MKKELRSIAEGLLDFLGLKGKTLSILITTDREIQEINKRFLGRDFPTNVISFSYCNDSKNFTDILGDIVISVDRAVLEARNSNVPVSLRLIELLIHGILHIIGYDHEVGEKERRRMRYMERKLLNYVRGLPQYETLLKLERKNKV